MPTSGGTNIGLGFSCLKSGVLCVYAAPETRVNLHAKQAFPEAQSCFHVFEIENKPERRRFDIERVKPKSGAELRTVANVYQTLCRLQPSDIPFDSPSDKAAFGFVSHLCRLRSPDSEILSAHFTRADLLTITVGHVDWTQAESVPHRPALFQDRRSPVRLAVEGGQRTCYRGGLCGRDVAQYHAQTIQ